MQRLLIVDDEPTLLALLRRYLEKQGYQVDSAESGEAALAAYGAHANQYAAIIADMTLPGMNGEELIGEFRKNCPSLPGILASGYPHEPKLSGVVFLQKPFLPQMLAEQVQKLAKR